MNCTAPSGSTTPSYQQLLSYDALDRLTSGPSGTMSYDPNHVHAADTASNFPNQYASYDSMGNMTCRNVGNGSGHTCGSGQTGALMTYDNEGRLSTWTAPSGTTASDSFLYDNEGNRVLQRTNDSNGLTDTITFDSSLEITLHNGTTTTTKYYTAGGQRVAMRTGTTLTSPFYYLVNDMQGGTSLVLTSGGGVQAVQLYAPYRLNISTDCTASCEAPVRMLPDLQTLLHTVSPGSAEDNTILIMGVWKTKTITPPHEPVSGVEYTLWIS